ncbi:hypothetical protein UFOVP1254_27 [uncultured Caudovirales phage]|uniref:Uncharacterized protein n=1 Tax=uncultured Caudovirales phage TaxID=2100421 RepID=A0A6J5RL52_9CAUD|nr:hypothetical protein UFOVP1254_27 [uncultured Caudovirales phage]
MKNVSPTGVNLAKKPRAPKPPVELTAPPAVVNAFTAMVAAAVGTDPAPDPAPVVAEPPKAETKPATPAFAHSEKNGRKDYKPGTTGARIFAACDALIATNPNIAITAKVLKVALPDVKESSLGCGLSHWRTFTGRTKALLAAAAKPATPAV